MHPLSGQASIRTNARTSCAHPRHTTMSPCAASSAQWAADLQSPSKCNWMAAAASAQVYTTYRSSSPRALQETACSVSQVGERQSPPCHPYHALGGFSFQVVFYLCVSWCGCVGGRPLLLLESCSLSFLPPHPLQVPSMNCNCGQSPVCGPSPQHPLRCTTGNACAFCTTFSLSTKSVMSLVLFECHEGLWSMIVWTWCMFVFMYVVCSVCLYQRSVCLLVCFNVHVSTSVYVCFCCCDDLDGVHGNVRVSML